MPVKPTAHSYELEQTWVDWVLGALMLVDFLLDSFWLFADSQGHSSPSFSSITSTTSTVLFIVLSKSLEVLGLQKSCKDRPVCLVTQLCPTLCDPMDYRPPGSSVPGILHARILEWVAISFSRGSSQPRHRTQVSCIAGRFFTIWATRKAPSLVHMLSQKSVAYFININLISNMRVFDFS